MAVTHQRITVSTTPIALNPVSTGGTVLYLRNESANATEIGGPGVTAGTGYPLPANTSFPWPVSVDAGDQLFAIRTAASDAIIAVVRT